MSRLRGGKPPEAHLVSHLCATQWLRGDWSPKDDWPLEARWRAAGAMFVGFSLPSVILLVEHFSSTLRRLE